MSSLERDVERYNKLQKEIETFRNVKRKKERKADNLFQKIKEKRVQDLRDILAQRGLAICSSHLPHNKKGKEIKKQEQLGVYPKEQMNLLYLEDTGTRPGLWYDEPWHIQELKLLCPEHFPKKKEWKYHKFDDGTAIAKSEAKCDKDGQIVLVVNGLDITEIVRKGGHDIELNGRDPLFVDDEIYRFFGISDLPEKEVIFS